MPHAPRRAMCCCTGCEGLHAHTGPTGVFYGLSALPCQSLWVFPVAHWTRGVAGEGQPYHSEYR